MARRPCTLPTQPADLDAERNAPESPAAEHAAAAAAAAEAREADDKDNPEPSAKKMKKEKGGLEVERQTANVSGIMSQQVGAAAARLSIHRLAAAAVVASAPSLP